MSIRAPKTENSGVLFIGKRFYTNKDALSERFGRIFHLPFEWTRSGYKVALWLIDYHTKQFVRSEAGALHVQSTPIGSWSFFRRFASAVSRNRRGVVVASGDCYIGLLGWILARLTHSLFVFDVYDKYDEFGGYRKPFGWDLFGFLLGRADLCMFASRALAARMKEHVRAEVEVVPNGVDAATFRAMDPADCRETLGLASSLTLIGYFGGMEEDRGVADLIEAVETVRSRGLDARLLICGKAHPDTPLDRDWIIFRGMVAHDLMPAYINASNMVVIPYRFSEFMDMGASCKIAEYLMCGKSLVSTSTPNFLSNFPEQAGEMGDSICRAGDPVDMARAIEHALMVESKVSAPKDLAWNNIAADAIAAIKRAQLRDHSHA